MPSIVWYIFGPTASALFDPSLLWSYRWRLLLLQPLIFLTITLIKIPYLLSPPFTTTSIPNRHGLALRTLIYLPKRRKDDRLSPLHISFHAGAFIGGFPETQAHFSKVVVEKTGAVVVAPHTRYAPRHVFPAMIEDAEDAVKYCLENCERLWGADPRCVTTDGFSAGGNLAVAVCQDALVRKAVKGVVTFYGVVCYGILPLLFLSRRC
jgi:acetyl esterase/lipase